MVLTSAVSRGRCSFCCWRMVAGRLLVPAVRNAVRIVPWKGSVVVVVG